MHAPLPHYIIKLTVPQTKSEVLTLFYFYYFGEEIYEYDHCVYKDCSPHAHALYSHNSVL